MKRIFRRSLKVQAQASSKTTNSQRRVRLIGFKSCPKLPALVFFQLNTNVFGLNIKLGLQWSTFDSWMKLTPRRYRRSEIFSKRFVTKFESNSLPKRKLALYNEAQSLTNRTSRDFCVVNHRIELSRHSACSCKSRSEYFASFPDDKPSANSSKRTWKLFTWKSNVNH